VCNRMCGKYTEERDEGILLGERRYRMETENKSNSRISATTVSVGYGSVA